MPRHALFCASKTLGTQMFTYKLKSNAFFPAVKLPLCQGGHVRLGKPKGKHERHLIYFHSGTASKECSEYLVSLDSLRSKLTQLKIELVAVSADSELRAREQLESTKIGYSLAYDLNKTNAIHVGLYWKELNETENGRKGYTLPAFFLVNESGVTELIALYDSPYFMPPVEALLDGLESFLSPSRIAKP